MASQPNMKIINQGGKWKDEDCSKWMRKNQMIVVHTAYGGLD